MATRCSKKVLRRGWAHGTCAREARMTVGGRHYCKQHGKAEKEKGHTPDEEERVEDAVRRLIEKSKEDTDADARR